MDEFSASFSMVHISSLSFLHCFDTIASILRGCIVSFFHRSFVLCGQEPSLHWTPARRPSIGPVRMPMERGRELVGVCGVRATCGRGRLSRHVCSLSGIYCSAPSRRGLLSD